jgi:cytochrome c oxidase assembly protein subunit 15
MSTRMRADAVIRRLALAALVLCCVVVVLGAYVRLTAAGLGCPDWPGCYGHLTPTGAEQNLAAQAAFPDRPLDVGKAWREMVHRYAAATLGLIIVVIAALAITNRRERIVGTGYALSLVGIVVIQGALGMLTVTWNLKPLIVTLHLLFGLTTLGLLWWLWLSLRSRHAPGTERFVSAAPRSGAWGGKTARPLILAALVILCAQIALGGWTSSNYAAVACPDLPKCQDAWWPQTDYRDAFVLWRGLGINYEGGVLDHPARVAIHLTHRIGAIVASLALLFAALGVLRNRALTHAWGAAGAVLLALGLQLTIGVTMIHNAFPLSLATAHNAGAALLLLAALALYRQATRYR